MKKISFIIPTWNSQKTICRTLDSIYNQRYVNNEVIVIDANSTDDTLKKLKIYKKIKVINSKIQSTSFQRNIGFNIAKGVIIFFVDSDVFLTDKIVNKVILALRDYDLVFTDIDFENNNRMYPQTKEQQKYAGITAFGAIKKESLKKLDKLFDSELFSFYLEDKDFFTRCQLFGLSCKYLNNERVFHINPSLEDKNQEFRLKHLIISKILFYNKYKGILTELKFKLLLTDLASLFFINTILNYSMRARYNEARKNLFNKILAIFFHKKMSSNYLKLYFIYFSSLIYALRNIKKAKKSREDLMKI
jgi:glycosyltransferase involved in cell wall biosynthesis